MKPASVAILHQGCVPTYRRAFYERLAGIASRRYVVFHGDPGPGAGITAANPPFGFEHVEMRNRFWRVLGRTLVYQPVFSAFVRRNYAALVIGHEVKYVANVALTLVFRALGKPVLLWGLGQQHRYAAEISNALGPRARARGDFRPGPDDAPSDGLYGLYANWSQLREAGRHWENQ